MFKKEGTKDVKSSLVPFKNIQIFSVLILSFLLNYMVINHTKYAEIEEMVNSFNVDRPIVLITILISLLSLLGVLFYTVFNYIFFLFLSRIIIKNKVERVVFKKYSVLFLMYTYMIIVIWNIINQITYIDVNPIFLTIPISNIIAYIFASILFYFAMLKKSKAYFIPLITLLILLIVNNFGELFIK